MTTVGAVRPPLAQDARARSLPPLADATAPGAAAVRLRTLLRLCCEGLEADASALLWCAGADWCGVVTLYQKGGEAAEPQGLAVRCAEAIVASRRSGEPASGGRLSLRGGGRSAHRALGRTRHHLALPLRADDGTDGVLLACRWRDQPFAVPSHLTAQLLMVAGELALPGVRLVREAEAARQAMTSFVGLMVHDLRAPLTVVSGYVEMLRRGVLGPLPARWGEPLGVVARKVRETQRLVDDILLAGRLDGSGLPYREERLDLRELAAAAWERNLDRARLAGVALDLDAAAGPILIRGERFHVARILDNLVNNAIVHGGGGHSVTISLQAGMPCIRIHDTGRGVDASMRERIFEPFVQGDSLGGAGLGLHIARRLATACGGSLELEADAPCGGATFLLRLRPWEERRGELPPSPSPGSLPDASPCTSPLPTTAEQASDPRREPMPSPDAIAVLKQDHRTVRKLFAELARTGRRAHATRRRLVARIITELSVHAGIEETVFYPRVRELVPGREDMVLESLEEHHIVKGTCAELERMDPRDERYQAKLTVLRENVEHHVAEEETELFPAIRRSVTRRDLQSLGTDLVGARRAVPSRPHPHAPDQPPGNAVAAAITTPMDRALQGVGEVLEKGAELVGGGAPSRSSPMTAARPERPSP